MMRSPALLLLALTALVTITTSCASHGRAERAGRAVDRTVDKAHRGTEDAKDDVEEGIERGADKVDRAVDELKK